MWRELRRELLVGVRQFRESRGALASLTLALGLGVASNVAIVSELRDLIAPVSFPGQQHVFLVQRTDTQPPADGSASPPNPRLSIPDFNDFAQQQARRRQVVGLVARRLGVALVVGGALGVGVGVLGGRTLASQLYGVKPTEAWTLFSAALLVVVIGLLASVGPLRRASRIDPARAIRET